MHRKEIAEFYHTAIQAINSINAPPVIDGATYSHFTILVKNREKLLNFALQHGVQLGILIEYCVPEMPAYNQYAKNTNFPIASEMSKESVNLPVTCSKKEAKKVMAILKKFYSITT